MITKTEWTPLQKEWFGCKYAAMQPVDAVRARCNDDAQRIENLEAALKELIADEWRMCADWGPSDERQELLARVDAVLANAQDEPRGE